MLRRAERWIRRRGYVFTLILIIIRPLLSVPAGVFSRSYFAFWMLVALAWGFGAAIVIIVLPWTESAEDINSVLSGIFYALTGKKAPQAVDPATLEAKELSEDECTPAEETPAEPAVKEASA